MNSTLTSLLCGGIVMWWYQEYVVQAVVIAAFVILGLCILLAALYICSCFLQLLAAFLPQPPSDGRLRPSMRPVPVYHRNYPYHS